MTHKTRKGSQRTRHDTSVVRVWLPIVLLLVVTFAVYGRVLWADFVAFDDGLYVTHNHHVPKGVTAEGFRWAFTTLETATWQPLTLLSHMLDVEMYGLWPGGHHLTSLLLHMANTLLLFLVLRSMTGDRGPSLFAAAVFALHPLHVESVAWVSERKDVLSTFFWLLTMLAYARYARAPGIGVYVAITLAFALGLMAKPMLVTLPFVMLLLDYWPLRRIGTAARPWGACAVAKLVLEKSPWLAMALASALSTVIAQRGTESLIAMENLPLGLRIGNAVLSYWRYIGKTIWPADLAVFYPFPYGGIPTVHVVFALTGLAVVCATVVYLHRRAPYVFVGWFWYLGTLVPVIGFVQVGSQAMADRYAYVPLIGLSMIPAWGVPALLARWSRNRSGATLERWYRSAAACAVALMAAWAWLSFAQVGTWRDSVHLFRHAAEVTENNRMALGNTGMALNAEERYAEAIPYLQRALKIEPDRATTLFDLAHAYEKTGRIDEAIERYREGLKIAPQDASALTNLGLCLLTTGFPEEALEVLGRAIESRPDFEPALSNYGVALIQTGHTQEALAHLNEAARKFPTNVDLRVNLGIAYAANGDTTSAIREFEAALQLDPENRQARLNAGVLRAGQPAAQGANP